MQVSTMVHPSEGPTRAQALPVLLSLCGVAALGAACASGVAGFAPGGGGAMVGRALVAAPAMALLPVVLTGPTLLVGRELLDIEAGGAELMGAVFEGVTRAGRLSAGLVPAVLFWGGTTELGIAVALLAVLGVSSAALTRATARLWSASGAARTPRGALMTLGWGALCTAVAARVAWDLIQFVAEG